MVSITPHDFVAINAGFGMLQLLLVGIACLACLAHWRVSGWVGAIAAGLAGLFLAGASSMILPRAFVSVPLMAWPFLLAASVLSVVSWGLIVLGLWGTLNHVRRTISLAKDRRHDLE